MDLGSNTFLLLIVEGKDKNIHKVHADEISFTRIGQGVDQERKFHKDALKRVKKCFETFSQIIKSHDVDKVQAVTTSASRDVDNYHELIRLGESYDIPIQVISGEKEAELTHKGTTFEFDNKNCMVIDIGGGSTEIVVYEDGQFNEVSLNVGTVRLKERFMRTSSFSKKNILSVKEFLKDELKKLPDFKKVDRYVAVAGTPTTLALLENRKSQVEKIHGTKLSAEKIRFWREYLCTLSEEERELIIQEKKRADVIPFGSMILEGLSEALEISSFYVSTYGVRYGLALELLSGDA